MISIRYFAIIIRKLIIIWLFWYISSILALSHTRWQNLLHGVTDLSIHKPLIVKLLDSHLWVSCHLNRFRVFVTKNSRFGGPRGRNQNIQKVWVQVIDQSVNLKVRFDGILPWTRQRRPFRSSILKNLLINNCLKFVCTIKCFNQFFAQFRSSYPGRQLVHISDQCAKLLAWLVSVKFMVVWDVFVSIRRHKRIRLNKHIPHKMLLPRNPIQPDLLFRNVLSPSKLFSLKIS